MIVEFFQHLRLPAAKWVKQMGYGREIISLEARHQRCHDAWAPHLTATRRLIIDAAADCQDTGHAVVLGSGALLDVPLHDLAARFDRVDLIDIVHPNSARRQAARFDNVRLIAADISGIAPAVYSQAVTADPIGARPPPPIGSRDKSCEIISGVIDRNLAKGGALGALREPRPDPAMIAGADFVVSTNVLAQLPLPLLDWLQAHRPFADDAARDAFGRSIIDHHLALLQHHPGRVVLITEVLRLITVDENPIEKIDPLFGAPIFADGEEWWWDVAPPGEIDRHRAMRLRVKGLPDLAKADQSRSCRNTTLAAP